MDIHPNGEIKAANEPRKAIEDDAKNDEMIVVHRAKSMSVNRVKLLDVVGELKKDDPIGDCISTIVPESLGKLAILAGRWKIDGTGHDNNKGYEIEGQQNYDWLAGGHFLAGSWTIRFGSATYQGLSILGFNAAKGTYYLNNYDNAGYLRYLRLEIIENTWTFTGHRERIRIHFEDSGKAYTEYREFSLDSNNWQQHCCINAVKMNE